MFKTTGKSAAFEKKEGDTTVSPGPLHLGSILALARGRLTALSATVLSRFYSFP